MPRAHQCLAPRLGRDRRAVRLPGLVHARVAGRGGRRRSRAAVGPCLRGAAGFTRVNDDLIRRGSRRIRRPARRQIVQRRQQHFGPPGAPQRRIPALADRLEQRLVPRVLLGREGHAHADGGVAQVAVQPAAQDLGEEQDGVALGALQLAQGGLETGVEFAGGHE